MDAPLIFALARARLRLASSVSSLWVSPRALCLGWSPDRRAGQESGLCWVFILQPSPELWLLHEKDPAMAALKGEAKVDLTRRWAAELKGASLESVDGDERERWIGLVFRRRALTGRIELMRLAFQAIPGRAGLRLDGLDLNPARMGMGVPFPATAPQIFEDSPPMRRWRERFGDNLAAALAGELPEVFPEKSATEKPAAEKSAADKDDIFARHLAWSQERASRLILAPKQCAVDRRLKREEEKLQRYGEALKQDRLRHEKHLGLREKARKLSAELWRFKGESGFVDLLDGTRIELPEGLRAQAAAQKWFDAVKRAERGIERLAVLEREQQRQWLEMQEKLSALAIPGASQTQQAGIASGKPKSKVDTAKEKKGKGKMDQQGKRNDKRSDGKGKAFRAIMIDGWEVLIGKGDADNDVLTFKVADGVDFWLHVASTPGSHVVIRNPDRISEPPREVLERAAQLAAFYSKARDGGKVEVHFCRVADVSKPRGFPAGKVMLKTYKSVRVYPKE